MPRTGLTSHHLPVWSLFALAFAWCHTATAQTASLSTTSIEYAPNGGTITFALNVSYPDATLSTLGASIALPAGWSFAAATGRNVPAVVPAPGTSEAAEFAYTTIPANGAIFSFSLEYTAGLTGNQTFSGVVQYKLQNGGSPSLQTIDLPAVTLKTAASGIPPTITSAKSSNAVAGVAYTYQATATTAGAGFAFEGLPPGLTADPHTGTVSGIPTDTGTFIISIVATNTFGSATGALTLNVNSIPSFTLQPESTLVPIGGSLSLTASASASPLPVYQWFKDNTAIQGATGPALSLSNFGIADAGSYRVIATNIAGAATSAAAIAGVASTAKVAGDGKEVGHDIVHANGNIYDQVLLTGAAATVTADAGKVTRISWIDLDDDIVQVELSGAGTLSLKLDAALGPAEAVKYNQPGVSYMKGHASIVVSGANETTNLSVFSVGPLTAVNQALFKSGETYDGVADIAFISIATTDGKFGGIRTANTTYFRADGYTGIDAPGVEVVGPVLLGELSADQSATPVLVFGSTLEVRVAGGDLLQLNDRPIQVKGISHIEFTPGATSGNLSLPAQSNHARFEEDGKDVTDQLISGP